MGRLVVAARYCVQNFLLSHIKLTITIANPKLRWY
jgi:hypothetical protein